MSVEIIDYERHALSELKKAPDRAWGSSIDAVVYDPRFEQAMDQILRWQNNHIRPPEGLRESDLGHIQGMEAILEEQLLATSPHLATEIDRYDTRMMIRVHDMGEILAGDLPVTNKDSSLRARKQRMEPLAVTLLTRNLPEEPKQAIRYYHHRYEQREPHDKEALLTKLIDVVQGNQFALTHNLYVTIERPEHRREHISGRIQDTLIWTEAVAHALSSRDAQQELLVFTGNELKKFVQQGYEHEIALAFSSL